MVDRSARDVLARQLGVVTAILQRHGVEALGGAADVDADHYGVHAHWGRLAAVV
jgi:hypothetical protein